ncbi:MAG: helicase-related protein [Alphaproteobacteria bacterium]
MTGFLDRSRITAVLGPTNTGKTYLAIERMLGHRSGMIGFPLRLLARENYDRICRLKGEGAVALVTGEEKILPPSPRYYVCTVESMPVDLPVEFLAVDEIQLAADRERGHVFTDRLLRARGQAETMFLGANTIRGLLKRLVPEADIIARPRFSKLTHAGARKLARLPPRSAIVAFSARDVYSIAELLRSQRGGVAVVLGALSPRTRNAQVAMYQAGEVDYLVATDAIGMGLNMDIDHVVFAARRKFDGWRWRDLAVAELAQIAGRAGRHMSDGTFGTAADLGVLDPETASAIEEHRFPPIKRLFWRNPDLDFSSARALLSSLQEPPPAPELVRGGEAEDQRALALLAAQPDIASHIKDRRALRLLWDVCQIPNFRNEWGEGHAQLLARIYRFLAAPGGRIPADYAARQLARLDRISGDIDMLMSRISHVRTWTYVAHRSDWLDDAETWQDRARSIEDRLSDALHQKLTQRFVDTRTAALVQRMRDGRDLIASVRPGAAGEGDEVLVEGQYVGDLAGFHFRPDPVVVGTDMRAVMTAARRALAPEMRRRVAQLAAADDASFALDDQGRIRWNGGTVAGLRAGRRAIAPAVEPVLADLLDVAQRAAIRARVAAWIKSHLAAEVAPLFAIDAVVDGRPGGPLPLVGGPGRGILYQLTEGLGLVPRKMVDQQLAALAPAERKVLARLGVRLGMESVYLPAMLRPRAMRIKAILWAAKAERTVPFLPSPGRVSLVVDPAVPSVFYEAMGYRVLGPRALRVDMLERFARHARGLARAGPFAVDGPMLSLAGCRAEETAAILSALGYRRQGEGKGEGAACLFRRPHPKTTRPPERPRVDSPFARLKKDWPTPS